MKLNQVTVPCLNHDASVVFYKARGFAQIVHGPPRCARFERAAGNRLCVFHAGENRRNPPWRID